MPTYDKRWKVKLSKDDGKVSVLYQIGLSDIRNTIGTARSAGNSSPVAGNVKPWLLKHVLELSNNKGIDNPKAHKIVIVDTKEA